MSLGGSPSVVCMHCGRLMPMFQDLRCIFCQIGDRVSYAIPENVSSLIMQLAVSLVAASCIRLPLFCFY